MGTNLRRIGPTAARALSGWVVFSLVYAGLGYFFTDRGRSFLSLLPSAAIAGVLFLVFTALISGYSSRRARSVGTKTPEQEPPSGGQPGQVRHD